MYLMYTTPPDGLSVSVTLKSVVGREAFIIGCNVAFNNFRLVQRQSMEYTRNNPSTK